MTTFRIMPRNTIAIADLKNQSMEQLAKNYDSGNKGYLTTEEAYRLFADKNNDLQPGNIQQVIEFLGGSQHKLAMRHLDAWEVMGSPWLATSWKGDFNIEGFGAGNVRVGRDVRPGYAGSTPTPGSDHFVFLLDLNLVDKAQINDRVTGATLVVGPKGFNPESGSDLAEAVEIPLTLAMQEGYTSYNRSGSNGWVPEKKFLAAEVDTADLRALAGGGQELEFFARLQTDDGRTLYINRDGKPFANFPVSEGDLKPVGNR